MTVLAEAFVLLHAEGAQLPAEVEAQAAAAATGAEAILAEGISAGVEAGAVGSEQGFVLIEEFAAEASAGAADALAIGIAEGGAAGAAAAGEELLAVAPEAGAKAGAEAGVAFSHSFAEVANETGGIAGRLAGKGLTGALTGAIVGVAVIEGLHKFVEAAEEAEVAQIKLEQTLLGHPEAADRTIESYNNQAAALQQLTGYQDEQITGAQSQLIQFGLTGDQVRELTPLVIDFAARTGKDLPAASSAAAKALLGTGRALKEVGIKFKDAGSVTANYEQLVSGLARTVGGFAESQMETLGGQTRRLGSDFHDLEESLGRGVTPALVRGVSIADKTVHVLDTLGSTLYASTKTAAQFTQEADGNVDAEKRLAEAFDHAIRTVGTQTTALDEGKLSVDDFRVAVQEEASSVKAAGGTQEDYRSIMNEGRAAIQAYRLQLTGLTTERQIETQAIIDEQLAELQLAGGAAAVAAGIVQQRRAQSALADAQAKVNRLREHGKVGTDKYRDAQDALLESEASLVTTHLGLVKSVGDLLIAQNKQGASAAEVRRKLREEGVTAGETKGQVDDLVRAVTHYISRQDEVDGKSITTTWSAPGLHEAVINADALIGKLAYLDSTFPGGTSGQRGKRTGGTKTKGQRGGRP